MHRLFGKLGTLESRFYLIFTLLFFATILTMQIISTRFTINSLRNSTLENNRLLVNELVNQIDTYIESMERISDAVVDAIMEKDPNGRVACETMVTTGVAFLGGENFRCCC